MDIIHLIAKILVIRYTYTVENVSIRGTRRQDAVNV